MNSTQPHDTIPLQTLPATSGALSQPQTLQIPLPGGSNTQAVNTASAASGQGLVPSIPLPQPGTGTSTQGFLLRHKRFFWGLIGTAIGIILSALALGPTWAAFDLAKWTALKDFRESCADQADHNRTLSASCTAAVNSDLPPPPYVHLPHVARSLLQTIEKVEESQDSDFDAIIRPVVSMMLLFVSFEICRRLYISESLWPSSAKSDCLDDYEDDMYTSGGLSGTLRALFKTRMFWNDEQNKGLITATGRSLEILGANTGKLMKRRGRHRVDSIATLPSYKGDDDTDVPSIDISDLPDYRADIHTHEAGCPMKPNDNDDIAMPGPLDEWLEKTIRDMGFEPFETDIEMNPLPSLVWGDRDPLFPLEWETKKSNYWYLWAPWPIRSGVSAWVNFRWKLAVHAASEGEDAEDDVELTQTTDDTSTRLLESMLKVETWLGRQDASVPIAYRWISRTWDCQCHQNTAVPDSVEEKWGFLPAQDIEPGLSFGSSTVTSSEASEQHVCHDIIKPVEKVELKGSLLRGGIKGLLTDLLFSSFSEPLQS